MHSAIIVADLNGRIFQWLDRTPTYAQRRQAETMAAYGIPEADIARVLGVSKPTLRKHCGTELDTGATRANSKVATSWPWAENQAASRPDPAPMSRTAPGTSGRRPLSQLWSVAGSTAS